MTVPIVPGRGDRDIRLNVTIDADTKDAKEAAGALGDVDKAAEKTGRSMRRMSDDHKKVQAEIRATTTRIEELERKMLDTGDRSLQRSIAAERRWLASVQRVTSVDFTRRSGAEGLNQVMMQLPRQLSGGGILAGLIGAAALGPLLGAATGGLLAGGLGTVGVGGAAAMSLQDPEVRGSAKAFGSSIESEFFRGGEAFVKPVREAMTVLDEAFKDMKLPEAFAKMAPHITTIADAFGDMGKNIMPGLNAAFERMGPFAEAAHEGISDLGTALGTFLDEITASPGAVMGLDAAFQILNMTIIGFGRTIRFLSDAFAGGLFLGEKITGFMEDIPLIGGLWGMMNDQINETMHGADGAADKVDEFAVSAESAAVSAEELANSLRAVEDGFSSLLSAELGAAQARLNVEQGWYDMAEAIRENGTSLDIATEAGLANQQMILDRIETLAASRDANIREGMAIEEANALYDDQIDKLINLGTKAGMSRTELEKLAKNYQVTVTWINNFDQWAQQNRHLIPGVGFNVTSFATGGTTPAFAPFRVHDGEMLFSNREHFVATKNQVDSMGGGTTQVNVGFSGNLDQFLAQAFMKLVREGQITISSSAVLN